MPEQVRDAAQVVKTDRGHGIECAFCGGKFVMNLKLLRQRIWATWGDWIPEEKCACHCPYCGKDNRVPEDDD